MAVPAHVAIIMDGNGRWAKARGLPRTAGHKAGMNALHDTVRNASELGIRYLTLYAFSSENWSRPAAEGRKQRAAIRRHGFRQRWNIYRHHSHGRGRGDHQQHALRDFHG